MKIMSNGEASFENSGIYEQFPGYALVQYFQNQFRDAYIKQSSETIQDNTEANGEFVRTEVLESVNAVTRGTDRIIVKPPHPNDLPGFYCEVYAIFDRDLAMRAGDYEPGASAESFVIRDFSNGRPGPFWSVQLDGARKAEIDDNDDLISVDPPVSDPEDVARNMLKKYKHYNIVASID